MVGSLWGGIILAGVYVWQVVRHNVPNFVGLLWPALVLSLGWNFLDYAFDPPGTQGGVVWGWLICGIVFVLLGGLPLLVMLPATVYSFTRERRASAGVADRDAARAHATDGGRVQPAAAAAGGGGAVVDELERLAKLHERGALAEDEYAAAKRMLL